MKILYIAQERRAAELAAFALRTTAPDLVIAWAATLAAARGWVKDNPSFALLVIEVQSDDPECAAFVSQLRSSGNMAPLVVVSNTDPAPPLASLKEVATQVVTKNPSFLGDLPSVVSRALNTPPPMPRRLVRVGYVGDATLARECFGVPGGPTEIVETAPGSDGTFHPIPADARPDGPLPFDLLLIEHNFPGVDTLAILKDITARRLNVPVVLVAEWVDDLAVLAFKLGVVDYVSKSRASYRALQMRLSRLLARPSQRMLETRLAEAEAASRRAEQLRLADAAASASKLAQQHADFTASLAELSLVRDSLQRRLAAAEAALETDRQRRAPDVYEAAAGLIGTQDEIDAELTQTVAADQLQGASGDTTAALEEVGLERRTAMDQALQRSAFDAELAAEVEKRQAIESRLTSATEALERAEQRHASAKNEAAALQRKLVDVTEALERAEERARADRQAASDEASQRKAAIDAALAEEVVRRQAVESRLADAVAALERAEQQHAAAMDEASTRFRERDERAAAELAESVSAKAAVENSLADLAAALERAEAEARADRQSASEAAAQRQTAFDAELAAEARRRQDLESTLADATAALERAEQRHASELNDATARLREHGDKAARQLAEAVSARAALESTLADTAAALETAQRRYASEIGELNARLVQHQKVTDARLAQAAAAFDDVQTKLVEAAAQVQRAEQQAAADRQAAAEDAARHRFRFEIDLGEEVGRRQLLEKQLADADARLTQSAASAQALQDTLAGITAELEHARQQAAGDRQAALERAAQDRAAFDGQLAQEVASRESVERALADALAARQRADEQHASEMEAAARRLEEFREQAETHIAHAAAEAAASLRMAVEEAAAAQRAAAEQAAQREAALETARAQEADRRAVVEGELADMRLAFERAERRFADQVAAMRQSARDHEARLEEQAARERAAWQSTLVERQQRIQQLQTEGADLANERGRLEALVARHAADLQDVAVRMRASEETAANALADVERRLAAALADHDRDRAAIAALEQQLSDRDARLEAARGERDRLTAEADRVPQLRAQIDETQAAHRRQFDRSSIALFRCDRAGAVTDVNGALANLLGYDSPDQLQVADFAATVFETGDELQWLVGRLASDSSEPTETTWKTRDGLRILVRLHAVPAAAGAIELAAEDVTTVRALEERLRLSQRKAAVARYATEMAITCDKLLLDVTLEAQRWLATTDPDAARRHGQRLLDEVARASGFLQQLSVCDSEEKSAFELVDVHRLLGHMQPVLKQIAGSRIDIVLPKPSAPLNLDVEVERAERILINVAAFGRERMPAGGRLTIEASSAVLDHAFVAQYPHVRSGPHVLLTVTEERGEPRPALPADAPADAAGSDAVRTASGTPGVDLGALQSLVSDSGGHLWITAEPSGRMVLKIHLPRRALDQCEPMAPTKPAPVPEPSEPEPAKPVRSRWVDRFSGSRPGSIFTTR